MATGTPVVAWRAGSVPEVVVDGVTGHICDSLEEMIAAVRRVGAIDRADCRAHVERNFSGAAMTDGYLRAYDKLLADTATSRTVEARPTPSSRALPGR